MTIFLISRLIQLSCNLQADDRTIDVDIDGANEAGPESGFKGKFNDGYSLIPV
jgi:hypothetical protein